MLASAAAIRRANMEEEMQLSLFLKRVLILDAASCLGMGAVLVPAAGALAEPLGLPSGLIGSAGLLLVPLGLFILWLGMRAAAAPAFVYLVIAGNVIWATESILLAFGDATITPLGTLFVAVQGVAVFGLAVLEAIGLRRSRDAATA
jgi:hypothetical protein